MLDRKAFFASACARPFGGQISPSQVNGIDHILDEWERRGLTDPRWLAYMLATTFHETGRRMVPVREGGSAAYLQSKRYWPWVGEGLVQVTWEANARKFGAQKPGDCMSWPVALRALFDGMIGGMFTGKKLADYFSDTVDNPVGARRIINGTDQASVIAGYHYAFLEAIKTASGTTTFAPPHIVPKPVPRPYTGGKGAAVIVATGAAGSVALAPQGSWQMATLIVLALAAIGVGLFIHFRK